MQRLQHEGGPAREVLQQTIVTDLIGDHRPDPTRAREVAVVEGLAVLSNAHKGGSQPAPGHQLVDGVVAEQVVELGG